MLNLGGSYRDYYIMVLITSIKTRRLGQAPILGRLQLSYSNFIFSFLSYKWIQLASVTLDYAEKACQG